MRTNRRIYTESVDLFQRENDFVCLTTNRRSWLGQQLFNKRRLQTIAQGPAAHGFSNITMTITLDPGESAAWPCWSCCQSSDSEDARPWKYIFCVDEMPTFCMLLLKLIKSYQDRLLRGTSIHIDINTARKGKFTEMDCNAVGLSRLEKLLGPLHQLHSFGAAQIEGPLSGSYKGILITRLCEVGPTAMEIMQTAMVMLSQGDEQIDNDRPTHAVQIYKKALNCVCSCCWL